jgi:hypothetical protein
VVTQSGKENGNRGKALLPVQKDDFVLFFDNDDRPQEVLFTGRPRSVEIEDVIAESRNVRFFPAITSLKGRHFHWCAELPQKLAEFFGVSPKRLAHRSSLVACFEMTEKLIRVGPL